MLKRRNSPYERAYALSSYALTDVAPGTFLQRSLPTPAPAMSRDIRVLGPLATALLVLSLHHRLSPISHEYTIAYRQATERLPGGAKALEGPSVRQSRLPRSGVFRSSGMWSLRMWCLMIVVVIRFDNNSMINTVVIIR